MINILSFKGDGATSLVYKVKDIKTKKIYACKIFKNSCILSFNKEKHFLKILTDNPETRPYIANMIESGKGKIIRKGLHDSINDYIILEYLSNGELYDYIYYPPEPFKELHSKYIFSKILKAVQAVHKAGICHRDLKLDNILVDEHYIPKLCDWGYADKNIVPLKLYIGTPYYKAPEILSETPYDGFLVDIFTLGVILSSLVNGSGLFDNANKDDKFYKHIINAANEPNEPEHIQNFWDDIYKEYPYVNPSEEFKELYIKMISYLPKDRPSIDYILNKSEWMKEIRDMNKEQLKKLESDVIQEFKIRENDIKEKKGLKLEVQNQEEEDNNDNINEDNNNDNDGSKAINDNKDSFLPNLKPDYGIPGINMENYIKIIGKMNPSIFMNELIIKINKEFNDCIIPEFDNNKLEFKIDIRNYIVNDVITMQLKLFESRDGSYLLRFVKNKGNKRDYLDNIKKITSLVKKII